jgi:hypothetical protein
MSNVPRWWVVDSDNRVLAGPFTSEENTEPVILWLEALDREDPEPATAAYGVRRPDGTMGVEERAQWWVVGSDGRVLSGPFDDEGDAKEGVLWTDAVAGTPSANPRVEYGVHRPDGTVARHAMPPEPPQWYVIDRNDNVLLGPFTTQLDAEAGADWVKARAPFHVDGGLDSVVTAYGVCHRRDILEHRSPTG